MSLYKKNHCRVRYPFLSAIIYFFGRRNLGAHTGYENPSGYITILLS